MKYLLANLVHGPAEKFQQELVRDLSERFDTHWLNDYWTPAHFTLKSLFDERHLTQVEVLLEEFSAQNFAYPAETRGCSVYTDAVMMDVHLSEDATAVYLNLIRALRKIDGLEWGSFEAEERHFHMSVALFDIDKQFEGIKGYSQALDFCFEIQFDNVALLEQNERGWILRRYFSLNRS